MGLICDISTIRGCVWDTWPMQSPWGVCVCIWQGQMLTGGPVWGEVDLEVQATQAELC